MTCSSGEYVSSSDWRLTEPARLQTGGGDKSPFQRQCPSCWGMKWKASKAPKNAQWWEDCNHQVDIHCRGASNPPATSLARPLSWSAHLVIGRLVSSPSFTSACTKPQARYSHARINLVVQVQYNIRSSADCWSKNFSFVGFKSHVLRWLMNSCLAEKFVTVQMLCFKVRISSHLSWYFSEC